MAKINQTITQFPTAPNSATDSAPVFNTKANAFVGHQAGVYVGEVNTWATEANALRDDVNNIVATIPVGTINDSVTDADKVWSSTKVSTKLNTKWDDTNNKSIGVNQTWEDLISHRAIGTTYTNDTGKPIQIVVRVKVGGAGSKADFSIVINGTIYIPSNISVASTSASVGATVNIIIPDGDTYKCESYGSSGSTLSEWLELR